MPRRDPEIPDLVSASWVAQELGVHRSRVPQLIEENELAGAQVENPTGDGTWVFRREVVEALKAKRDSAGDLRLAFGEPDGGVDEHPGQYRLRQRKHPGGEVGGDDGFVNGSNPGPDLIDEDVEVVACDGGQLVDLGSVGGVDGHGGCPIWCGG